MDKDLKRFADLAQVVEAETEGYAKCVNVRTPAGLKEYKRSGGKMADLEDLSEESDLWMMVDEVESLPPNAKRQASKNVGYNAGDRFYAEKLSGFFDGKYFYVDSEKLT